MKSVNIDGAKTEVHVSSLVPGLSLIPSFQYCMLNSGALGGRAWE